MRLYWVFLAVVASISAVGIAHSQEMQRENTNKVDLGKNEFELNCAVCHGLQGRGDGPYAGLLKTPVPDLTPLQQLQADAAPDLRRPPRSFSRAKR